MHPLLAGLTIGELLLGSCSHKESADSSRSKCLIQVQISKEWGRESAGLACIDRPACNMMPTVDPISVAHCKYEEF